MRRLFAMATIAAAVALSAPPHEVCAATPADMLVVAQNIDDIVSLDPAQAYEFTSGEIVANLYDRLVQYDAENTEMLVGGLAEDWAVSDDGRTITFTLRDDVTFHSGNPVRPEDVVFSFSRVVRLNKAPAFILTQLGWTSENVEEMVRVAGPNQVSVAFAGDFSPAFVLNVLAARPGSIVDQATVMANERGGDLGNAWLNANSAGTGPFRLRTYRPNELLAMDANPGYFRGAPAMKSVVIRHVAEPATQRLMLEAGDVDLARNLTPDQIAGLAGRDDIRVETYPQAAIHFLSFNQKTEALTPKAVWEAARYLVDYEGMTNSFLRGQMQVHQAFWPKGFPGALTDTPYSYDPEKARRILADAGVETPITVTLDVISSPPFTDVAQALQASFAGVGIDFEIIPGTGNQVITKYRARNHQAMLLYWGPDFMDPHSNAKAFAYNADNSDGSYQSTTTWRNAWAVPDEMNALTMAALAEQDEAKRREMYLDLQRRVQAESPIVVMFQAVNEGALRDGVEGFVNGTTSDFVFYRLVTKQ